MSKAFKEKPMVVESCTGSITLKPITDEKIKKELTDKSIEIQPDVRKEADTKGLSKKDVETYDEMMKIYDDLCKKDQSFTLTFVCPDSYKPFLFFRICDIDNQERYQKSAHYLLEKMFSYLYWCGFLKKFDISLKK